MPKVHCRHDRAFEFKIEKTALLVIDMQGEFLDPQGAVALAGGDVAPLRAIVPTIAGLLDKARETGLTVAHTREGHDPTLSDLPETKRAQYSASGIEIGSPGPLGRLFVRGERGHNIIPELAPLADEWVIDKPGFGAFHATDLDQRLRNRGISHLILTGVTTQCCVHSTLREAIDRGYHCLTLEDATATEDPAIQAATLKIIASEGHLFGWIAKADDVIAEL
ncbi:MAG: isochorismatase family cysteine hydrolase [Pseudomonadota bacterium]